MWIELNLTSRQLINQNFPVMIKKLLALTFMCFFFSQSFIQAQVSLNATGGTPTGMYISLGDAFAKINDGTHQGNIIITLSASVSETTTATLDSSGNPTSSNYTSVTIIPQTATAITISGSVVGPLVNLNGADNVVFDGINAGGASITIHNADVSITSSAIRFINDASNNKILNSTIRGAGAGTAIGVVHFSTGLLTGNDKNKIKDCNIDGTANAPTCLLSVGSTTNSSIQNSEDTLQNCLVYDYFNASSGSIGVNLSAGNTNWLISGNSFYQTVGRSTAAQNTHVSLQVFPNWTSDTHIITGNFSGGTSANGVGLLTYTGTSTNAVGYIGFSIQTGGPGNLVEGNTCKNVQVIYASVAGSFQNAGFFGFIGGFDGTTTFSNNTVDNFIVTNNNGAALGYGIGVNGRVFTAATTVKPVFNILNNTITNLNFNAGGTGSAQSFGIRLETSSANTLTTSTTISNPRFNVIGNTITNLNITIGGASGWTRGIGTVNTNGTSSTCPLIPKSVIQSNIISAISCSSSLASAATNTAVGIQHGGVSNLTGTNVVDTTLIKGNTIFNINSTNTADLASSVAGIIGTNGIFGIIENKIYNLKNSSIGATTKPIVAAINIRASLTNAPGTNSFVANNFVSLGTGNTENTSYFGILNNFNATAGINCYYNSIAIGGTAASGSNPSGGIYRGPETFVAPGTPITTLVDIKNNILINQRSGGTGINFAIGSYATGSWTSNYNNLLTTNASDLAYWNAASNNFTTFQTNSAGEANSKSVAVNFVNAAIGDLHLTGASNGDNNLRCNPLAGYTTDFDNQIRNSINPYMGADEATIALPLQLLSFNGVIRDSKAMLSWITCCEVNMDKFEVEKSINNGSNWTTAATVIAKGDIVRNEYGLTELNLQAGKYFYRLKMIDKDGRFRYSQIISLEINKGNQFVLNQNYPNPVKGSTRISYSLPTNGLVSIEVLNIEGKRMTNLVNAQQLAGSYNIGFNSSQINNAKGNYFYRIIVKGKNNEVLFTETKQMVVVE